MIKIVIIWNYLLFILIFCLTIYGGIIIYSKDRSLRKKILSTSDIILSEKELQRKKDGFLITFTTELLPKIDKYINIERIYGNNMKKMLKMMGDTKGFEKTFADHIVSALLVSSLIFLLPLITGSSVFIILYPLCVIGMMYYQFILVKSRYKKWQSEVSKDLPELIDKMRISLASGKDYISAFKKVQDNSGPRLSKILEKLINNMQIMRPTQALDEFGNSFGMPIMTKFVAAVKIGIDVGYEQAENYFINIEDDIKDLRKLALEELTKNKPEKVIYLQGLIIGHALIALALTAINIIGSVNQIF